MNLKDCHSIEDFKKLAKKRLPSPIFHYIEGGSDGVYLVEDEGTLNWLEGNIDRDPYFVHPGYWDVNNLWVEGDNHLQWDSVCIDACD